MSRPEEGREMEIHVWEKHEGEGGILQASAVTAEWVWGILISYVIGNEKVMGSWDRIEAELVVWKQKSS